MARAPLRYRLTYAGSRGVVHSVGHLGTQAVTAAGPCRHCGGEACMSSKTTTRPSQLAQRCLSPQKASNLPRFSSCNEPCDSSCRPRLAAVLGLRSIAVTACNTGAPSHVAIRSNQLTSRSSCLVTCTNQVHAPYHPGDVNKQQRKWVNAQLRWCLGVSGSCLAWICTCNACMLPPE